MPDAASQLTECAYNDITSIGAIFANISSYRYARFVSLGCYANFTHKTYANIS